jgi:hypothetical protein
MRGVRVGFVTWGCFVTVCGFAVLHSGRALAGNPRSSPLALRWEVVDGCPDAATAQHIIGDFLEQRGTQLTAAAAASVIIRQQPDRRFQAEISVRDASGSGERHIEGTRCDRVAEAAALIVAMTLESIELAERLKSPPAPLLPSGEPTRFSISAGVTGDIGSLPLPSLGVSVGLGLQLGLSRVEATGTAWLPRLGVDPSSGGAGEIGLFSAGIRGCYDVLRAAGDTLGVGPCLGAEVGLSFGRGVNQTPEARSEQGAWWAVLAGVELRQRTESGFGTWFSLEAGVPISRPVYVIEGAGRIFRASPVLGRAALGIAWTFR